MQGHHASHSWIITDLHVGLKPVWHRENSPDTQSTPEPPLLSWGEWPREKKTPDHMANSVLSYLSGYWDPIVLEPFDVSGVSWMSNLLKISLDM